MAVKFAVDIDDPKVKLAMQVLGIKIDDLSEKTLEDFGGTKVSPEMQNLRFQHYCYTLKQAVADIDQCIQDSRHRSHSAFRLDEGMALNTPSNSSSKTKFDLTQTRIGHMKALARTVSEEQRKQEFIAKQNILLQSKKSTRIKSIQPMPVKPYDQRLALARQRRRDFSKAEIKLNTRNQSSIDTSQEVKRKESKVGDTIMSDFSRSLMDDNYYEEAVETEKRMEAIQAKFLKSEELRHKLMTATQEKAARARLKHERIQACLSDSSFDTYGLAIKLITRHQEAARRRMSLKKDQQKPLKASEILSKKEQELEQKVKLIEERQRMAEQQVSMKRQAAAKELDLKHEASRLKDLFNSIKQDRKTKIRRFRRIEILSKQLDKAKQVEILKTKRQQKAAEARDLRIQSMIEKERFIDLHSRVLKSPNSKLALNILKDYS